MTATKLSFPTERAEKRRVLLDAVESVRTTVEAYADEAEAQETLPQPVVEALADAGLFALKLPAELGGAEADPVTQLEVIEAMARIDTSAGWAVMIGATSIGWPGAFLPDAGIEVVFKDGRIPTAAGIGGAAGRAVPVEGGHRVTGRFLFASGARHAEWMIAGAPVYEGDAEEQSETRTFVVPVGETTIHLDSWHVAGLKGTGSCDFSMEDVFVPSYMSWDRGLLVRGEPERGGPIFRLGMPAFTANEHAAFALGAARRALDLVIEQSLTKRRGPGAGVSSLASRPGSHGALPVTLAERSVFQSFIGKADEQLKAARAQTINLFQAAWESASAGVTPPPEMQAEIRAASTYVVEVACDIATEAFRYAGGAALQGTNLLQRYWRDIIASGQHMAVSNAGYEGWGQVLLGMGAQPSTPGANARA